MNGRDWIRRHSTATTVAPERNGAGPAEAVRIREREAEGPAAARLRPNAQRLLQPLPLVGMLLVLIALVGYWSVYRASTTRTPVLVAAHALSAGSVLHASDLRTGELAGDGRTMAALVPERELDAVLGRTLSVAVPAGTPLPRAALGSRASGTAAFTLVLPALHALAGQLAPGDRVSVIATYGSGSGQARTKAIARGLEVLSIGSAPSGIDSAAASIPITLALPDPSLASALALANSDAKLDLLRESGRARAAPIPPASETGGP
ncbi:MAG: RcpC/CpaB family pilus assembly protein [Gaiellaceae bacterium]